MNIFRYDKTSFIEDALNVRQARDMLKLECMKLSNMNQMESYNDVIACSESNSDDFFPVYVHTSRRNSVENDIDSEIVRYFNDDRKDLNILNEFPNIKRVFFRFNTTLSSSASVERVFSQSQLIFRPRRNRLSAENFERTLLYKHNRKILNL